MRRLLLIALAVPLLVGATKAPAPLPAPAADDPVKITSDKFVVDDTAHLATFSGNVIVTRTSLNVWAPKVVVDYGDGGPSNIRSFIATGGVRIKTPDQDATGEKAVYNPKTQLLRLTGNVMVINGSGTVGSPDLLVDLANNVTVFSSAAGKGKGKGPRVTGIFTPK